MNKKVKIIMAAFVAILIIVVGAILLNGNKVEPIGKDMDVEASLEDSLLDDENSNESSEGSDASNDSLLDDENSNESSEGSDASNDSEKDISEDNDNNEAKENGTEDSQVVTGSSSGTTDYEKFHAMSPVKQQKYMESFGDVDKFFEWYNKAKKEYEKKHPEIEVDGDTIELQ